MLRFLPLFCVFLLTACALPAPKEDNSKELRLSANATQCRMETVIGTRIPTHVCRSAEQIAQDKQDARDLMRGKDRVPVSSR